MEVLESSEIFDTQLTIVEMEVEETVSCDKQFIKNDTITIEAAPMELEEVEVSDTISHEKIVTENVRNFPKSNFPIASEIFELYQEQIEFQQTQIQFLYRFIDYQNSLMDEKDNEIKKLQQDFKDENERKNKIIIRCEHELNKMKTHVRSYFFFILNFILNNLYCSYLI